MTAIFGGGATGASKDSQAAQIAANKATEKFIRERSAEARADVQNIFPQAQQVATEGFQGALDVISGGIPQQLGAFQQGNVGAQQVTANTLPQVQNAILGLPVNQAGFAPQQIQTDLSFIGGLTAPTVQPLPQEAAPPINNGFNNIFNRPGGGFPNFNFGGF